MAELLIRPGANDHQVVADLLAPGGSPSLLAAGRPLISRLVADAHVAAQRPQLAQAARNAGIPYLIDPLTHLLQGELREADAWAHLPFGRAELVGHQDLATDGERDDLVQTCVDFQVETGATAVIAPFAYAASPDDPWFECSLDLIRRSARHMARAGIRLPLIPVLCAQLQTFGAEKAWPGGVDQFTRVALEVEAHAIALALSPAGGGRDSYHKVLRLFTTAQRVVATGVPVLAWHQGIYGAGLVAAGVVGYETGIGTNEQCNIVRSTASRKPKPKDKRQKGGAVPGVFLEPLGRSVPAPVAQALLGDLRMRAKVMCDDQYCCPQGPASTLDQHREHAVRSRARVLAGLEEMPKRDWRLHRIARDARASVTLIGQANKTLSQLGIPTQIRSDSAASLSRVAEYLSTAPSANAG